MNYFFLFFFLLFWLFLFLFRILVIPLLVLSWLLSCWSVFCPAAPSATFSLPGYSLPEGMIEIEIVRGHPSSRWERARKKRINYQASYKQHTINEGNIALLVNYLHKQHNSNKKQRLYKNEEWRILQYHLVRGYFAQGEWRLCEIRQLQHLGFIRHGRNLISWALS